MCIALFRLNFLACFHHFETRESVMEKRQEGEEVKESFQSRNLIKARESFFYFILVCEQAQFALTILWKKSLI